MIILKILRQFVTTSGINLGKIQSNISLWREGKQRLKNGALVQPSMYSIYFSSKIYTQSRFAGSISWLTFTWQGVCRMSLISALLKLIKQHVVETQSTAK